jgi:hypothetical protein
MLTLVVHKITNGLERLMRMPCIPSGCVTPYTGTCKYVPAFGARADNQMKSLKLPECLIYVDGTQYPSGSLELLM